MEQTKTPTRKLLDIPELVARLRDEKARQLDVLAPQGKLLAVTDEQVSVDGKGKVTTKTSVKLAVEGHPSFGIMEQAHGQLADKMGIPMKYYNKMLGGKPGDMALLTTNLNHWLTQQPSKKRLVRTMDGLVRGYLSSRYRPISHLDTVTQGVQVVTGQENTGSEWAQRGDRSWALGARCFGWRLTPMHLDVSFVNPRMGVDLNDLNKGVMLAGPEHVNTPQDGGWLRGVFGKGGLFPCVRIRNSETGHGGLEVVAGLYEAICDNACHFGTQLAQVHLGRELTENELWSADTNRRINEVIFAKVRDVVRSAFDPKGLLEMARRFKGLEEVRVDNVKEATECLVTLAGLSEDVRDDILAAYYQMTEARGNLFDLQRAVTGAAHLSRQSKPEQAAGLEDLGGVIVERGGKVLVAAK